MNEWEQKLIVFLEKHNALSQFVSNLNSLKRFNEYPNTINFPKAYLSSSFQFNSTPEGVSYWMNLERLWQVECGDVCYIPT